MKIVFIFCIRVIDINNKLWQISVPLEMPLFSFAAYTTFFIVGLILSMQIPFVGFQPIKTSEHMASAGMYILMPQDWMIGGILFLSCLFVFLLITLPFAITFEP